MRLHCIDTQSDVDGVAGNDKTPLVVLHGLFGSADNWRSHIKQWQRERRVIAVDLRNHGRSPHGAGMDYSSLANDVIELLDALEVEQFDLLGHSMGGKVAMNLARQHPKRVTHLIVADIAPVAYEHGHDDVFAAMRGVESAAPTSRREADDVMSQHITSEATRQFLATNLVREGEALVWRVGLEEIAEDYDAIVAAPGGTGSYDGPSLLIRGGNSDYVLEAYRDAILDVMPKVDMQTLEGAGHWLHAEQATAFRRAVDEFLAHT